MRRPIIRTFHHAHFDVATLVRQKSALGQSVTVALPARDEEATIGPIVDTICREGVRTGLVDEVLVVDDHSSDATAEVAAAAGARVVAVESVLPDLGPGTGKGEALYKSVAASTGDIIAWCDADIVDFGLRFVAGLLGPLLQQPELEFVKGFYDRPIGDDPQGGGRVTELMARPVIATMFPHLGSIVQPLSGEYAGRRRLLEQLPFVQGYGVELGLLVDIAERRGTEVMAQVDLGVRHHRNRPIEQLSPQALAILQTALRRAGTDLGGTATLVRPSHDAVTLDAGERPPLAQVPGYRRRTA